MYQTLFYNCNILDTFLLVFPADVQSSANIFKELYKNFEKRVL